MGRRQEPLRLRALTAENVGPAGGLPRDQLASPRGESTRGIHEIFLKLLKAIIN